MNNKTMVGLIFSHMDNKNGKNEQQQQNYRNTPKKSKNPEQNNPIQTKPKTKKLSNQTQTQTQNKPTQFKPKKNLLKKQKTKNQPKPIRTNPKKEEAKSISNQNTKPGKKTQDNIIHDKENIRQGPKTGDGGRRGGESGLSCKVTKASRSNVNLHTSLSLSLLIHSLCLIFVVGNLHCLLVGHTQ
jgi:hypothetical protein